MHQHPYQKDLLLHTVGITFDQFVRGVDKVKRLQQLLHPLL